ncbi:hypothetical protein [Pseudobutyrivibrio xylanivorans]|nr:hypothetical protein [Pseudobutyrivibrio xylanivorans]
MKKKYIIGLYAVAILAVAGIGGKHGYDYICEKQLENAAKTVVDVEAIKNDSKTVKLKYKERDDVAWIFRTAEYNGLLRCTYDSADEIDWNEVLAGGAGICDYESAADTRACYMEANKIDADEIYSRILAISSDDLEKYVYQKSGKQLKEIKDDLEWTYFKAEDVYLCEDDYSYEPYECVSAIRNGNIYVLEMESLYFNNYNYYYRHPSKEIVLIKTLSGYMVKSSRNVWETSDHSSKEFDIDLPLIGDDIKAYAYKKWDKNDEDTEASVVLVKGNDKYDVFGLGYSYNDDSISLIEANDVEAVDVNADGLEDIVVVGPDKDNNLQAIIAICEKDINDDYVFFTYGKASAWVMDILDGDIGVQNIKKALKVSDDGKYDTWQAAYKQFVKIDSCYSDKTYSLAFIDEDDIPELIVEDAVCEYLYIYSYKDGKAKNRVWEWDYWVDGEAYYKYSEKKNLMKRDETTYGVAYYHLIEDGVEWIENIQSLGGEEEVEKNLFVDLKGQYTGEEFMEILDSE